MNIYGYLAFHFFILLSLVVAKRLYPKFVTPSFRTFIVPTTLAMFPLLIFDHLVTNWFWSFNSNYILPIPKIGAIPIEEFLFFFIVSFALLTIVENLKKKKIFFKKNLETAKILLFSLFIGSIVISIVSMYLNWWYTSSMAIWLSVLLIIISQYSFSQKVWFWTLLLLTIILTTIFNMYLTALPIVVYNNTVKSNLLIGTIPIEDYLFGTIMLFSLILTHHDKIEA